MNPPMESEKLLENQSVESDSGQDNDVEERYFRRPQKSARWYRLLCAILLSLIIATNSAWYSYTQRLQSHCGHFEDVSVQTYYLEESDPVHVWTSFDHDWQQLEDIEYGGYRYGDVHWDYDAWVPAKGASVAIPREFQEALQLDSRAASTADNTSNYHYLVAGYHQLHCLRVVRDSVYYLNGTLTEWPGEEPFMWDHVIHCIEAVRQALACSADPTLIPLANSWPGIPNGQKHLCRNREALYKWTSKWGHDLPHWEKQQEAPHTKEWYDRIAKAEINA